jgi:NAD(P)-dependent dehydrogenase (short-subunit alcohol dehydrogenase family)
MRKGLSGLEGRVAMVTGGAGGLGRAICDRLREEGTIVVSADLRPGPNVDHDFDVRDVEQWATALSTVIERHCKLDILVNNAGISGTTAYAWELPLEDWKLILSIDLDGVFYGCRTVLPHMLERGYGRIVNMASVAAKDPNPKASAYAAAKAGVVGMSKAIAKEVCTQGVLINCVTPAAVETPIHEQSDPAFVEYVRGLIPMGRFGRPQEVAAMVAWLSSEECSFTTGAVFDISGGRSSY